MRASLAFLRKCVRSEADSRESAQRIVFGVPALDSRLDGGLVRAAVHEWCGRDDDSDAVAGLAALLALRACDPDQDIVWVRDDPAERLGGKLHGEGLGELGIDPARVLIVRPSDTLGLLRAGADIVKCSGVGAVVLEPRGKAAMVDLTASRRLSLAAAKSGVTVFLLRIGSDPMPSAAQTRWRVAAAPSEPLPGNAPGPPAFDIDLLRHRGGIEGVTARIAWDRTSGVFSEVSGGLAGMVAERTGTARAAG